MMLPQNQPGQFSWIPSPVGGINLRDHIASLGPRDALQLVNWIAYPEQVRQRPGYVNQTTSNVSSTTGAVMLYSGGASNKIFAGCSSAIFDVTSTTPVNVFACTNREFVYRNFATAAGRFLLAVNAADGLIKYNGTTWSAGSDVTGIPTNEFRNLEVYNQRLFFTRKESTDLYYLAAGSVAGALLSFPVGTYLRRGGSIVALGTWTIDSGAGTDDRLVVLTSEGEAAVYQGTDPADPAKWRLVGVYYVGEPLGRNCITKYGGDLLILTVNGIFPLSKTTGTIEYSSSLAITDKINRLFTSLAKTYKTSWGWQIVIEPNIPAIICNVPASYGLQLVMQTQSRGWTVFEGWPHEQILVQGNTLYSIINSRLVKLFTTYADNGLPYFMKAIQAPKRERARHINLVRPTFMANGPFSYGIRLLQNFEIAESDLTFIGSPSQSLIWDQNNWDQANWSSDGEILREWNSVPNGHSLECAIALKSTSVTGELSWLTTEYISSFGNPVY